MRIHSFMIFPIKFTRRSVFIILVSVGILSFAFVIAVLLSHHSYLGSIFNRTELVTDDTVNENPEETSEESNGVSYVGGFKNEVVCRGDGYNLAIETVQTLKPVVNHSSLFQATDKSQHIYDFDQDSLHYQAGTVVGTLGDLTISTKTPYYIGIYKSYNTFLADWEEQMIRYLVLDSNIYIITGPLTTDNDGVVIIDNIGLVGEIYDEDSQAQETGILEANVSVLKPLGDYVGDDCFMQSSYLQQIRISSANPDGEKSRFVYLLTEDNVLLQIYGNEYKRLKDVSGYTQVDSYMGLKILRNENGKIVLEDREGFLNRVELELGWSMSEEFVITLQDGTSSNYPYISEMGQCELDIDGSYSYVYEDVVIDDLENIGVAYGNNVYQKRNIAEDEFTRKLYDEDYVGAEYWKNNTLEVDDAQPIAYDVYLTYHPVLYVKDPYGYFIRLTNAEFYFVGGCAKPAIYLYPEETADISVKVVPNGRLVFTLPKYVEGWNVRATSDGSITNLLDGEQYDYLWWDSVSFGFEKPHGGFIVPRGGVEEFLIQKLSAMNLNSREILDFNEYWVPKLTHIGTEFVYISFLFNDEVNQIARLEISPSPENIFRVFMLYEPVEGDMAVMPLKIESANRQGYTLVEWGGAEI